ncbi:MAG: putative tail tubular protein [Prokaryotic dsDNA virus sp.]|nr:MAG: putative tail tubular protein [Prokaryotic dsDNA virus sp.]|tara:strand:- start:8116 stop:11016 length:2901 start_codon:yes stop_codon:yes gene_type:complete
MLISKTLPNLMNGVSQQPDALRYDTQATAQENAYPSVVEGLTKRLPTEHICKTNLSTDAKTFVHTINRGSPEQYTVLIRDQMIRVYDINGNLQTVEMGEYCGADNDNVTYLDTDNADTAIKATTIADVTYIANTETKPTMTGTTDTSPNPFEALVFIKQAADTIYKIDVTQVGRDPISSTFNADATPTVSEITTGLAAALGNETASQSFTDANSAPNLSTGSNKVAQAFQVQNTKPITAISWKTAQGYSSAHYNMRWSIWSDSGSDTPGTRLTSHKRVNWPNQNNTIQRVTFDTPFTPVADTTYWIVVEPGTNWNGSQLNYVPTGWMRDSVGGYPVGGVFTATAFYANAAQTGDMWFKVHQEDDSTEATMHVDTDDEVLYITSSEDFTITVTSDLSPTYIDVFKEDAQTVAELPTRAKDGMILHIEGDVDGGEDDYYVRFVSSSAPGELGKGVWEECAKPGIERHLDASKMPHLLIRQENGTFVFKQADGENHTSSASGTPTYDYSKFQWGERKVGDTRTNPDPTFVTDGISNMFLFKNRFGILAGENIVMSEAGEFFNFFRFTVVDLLDTAPIDIASATGEISSLKSATPVSEKLILFSEKSQFILQSDTVLSSKTASIARATSYDSIITTQPVASENSVFFPFDRGSFSGVREYVPIDIENNYEGVDISTQVPKYIPGKITKMTSANHENVICCLTDGDTDAIYVYNYYNTDRKRIQSAWHRWELGTGSKIYNIEFVNTDLIVTVYRAEGVFIEKMAVEIGKTDTGSEYVSRLDRRFTQDSTGVSVSNKTITMPYNKTAGRSIEIISTAGERIAVASQADGSNQITADRDMTGVNFYAGEAYEMSYTFSDLVLREGTQSGGLAVMTEGRMQVRYGTITYGSSGSFTVNVTPDFRDTSTHEFTGKILGAGTLLLGSVPMESGEFRFPVFSKADQVAITVKNDTPLPTSILSAEFELSWNPRSRRM